MTYLCFFVNNDKYSSVTNRPPTRWNVRFGCLRSTVMKLTSWHLLTVLSIKLRDRED